MEKVDRGFGCERGVVQRTTEDGVNGEISEPFKGDD